MNDEYDIVEALEALGIKRITERGDEVNFSCPQDFHARGDRNPSASVNTKNYTYHCFSCGASGTLYTLVADVLGVSPAIAIRWLREKFWLSGGDRAEQKSIELTLRNILEDKTVEKQEPKWLEENDINAFNVNWPAVYEHYIGNPDGWMELYRPFSKYGLDVETCQKFRLGYDYQTKRITIPIRNIEGKIVEVKGRSANNDDYPKYLGLGNRDTDKDNRYMFPRIKDSGLVFGLDTATPDLIICEGEFDAMSMRSKGFTGSIATGSCQVSEKQVNNIIKKAERITILFDPDEAGLEGANKLTDLLYGTVPVRIGLLGSSDPAETSAEELQEIVKKAKTPLEFKEYIKKNKE